MGRGCRRVIKKLCFCFLWFLIYVILHDSCEFSDVFADAGERVGWIDDVYWVIRFIMHSQKERIHVCLVCAILTIPFVDDG